MAQQVRMQGVLTAVAPADHIVYIDGRPVHVASSQGKTPIRQTLLKLQTKVGHRVDATVTVNGSSYRATRRDIRVVPQGRIKSNPNFSIMHADGSLTSFVNPKAARGKKPRRNPNFSVMHANGTLTPFWNPRNPSFSDYVAAGKRVAAHGLVTAAAAAKETVSNIQQAAREEAARVRTADVTPKQALQLLASTYGLHVNPRATPLKWAYWARNSCWLAKTQKAAFEIVQDFGYQLFKGKWSRQRNGTHGMIHLGTYPTLDAAKQAAVMFR